MKLTFKNNFVIAILLLFAFVPIIQSQSIYQNECMEISNDGHITVKIWNPKKGKRYKMKDAQRDALQVVLINGIASNKQCIGQKPLLQNEKENSGFDKISKDFFKTNGNWLTYIHSSKIENALPDKIGEKNWKVYQVTVDRRMLKKYLEEQEIIKPINTGF
jgi:hypothetical protein